MLLNLWSVVVAACCFAALLHPTKKGLFIGASFLVSILIPELLRLAGFDGKWYASACFLGITFSMCLLTGYFLEEVLAKKLFSLLVFFEIPLNIFGIFSWEYHWHLHISNFIYGITGFSPATALVEDFNKADWLYLTLAILNYLIALWILLDREGRKQNVGYGVADLLGDKLLSPFIRFKGICKWEK